MRHFFTPALLLPILCLPVLAQDSMSGAASSSGGGLLVDPAQLHLSNILAPPPPADKNSDAEKADLAELHRIEQARSPAQVAAAQADANETDIFIFRTVLGEKFSAERLPLTAALSDQVHREVPRPSVRSRATTGVPVPISSIPRSIRSAKL